MADRTPEEREAARLERERRRAGPQSVQPAPPPPPVQRAPEPARETASPPAPPPLEPPTATAPAEDGHLGFEEPAGTRRVSRGSRLSNGKRTPGSPRAP